jgi:hypothetical protein
MLRRFDGKPVSGRLVYRRSEHSLDVEPRPERGAASLLVNDVQIEIDEDGRLIYVWGLCPHESWKPSTLDVPASKPGRLQYVGGEVVPGVSKRLNAGQRWNTSHDSSSQWLCIGDESAHGEMIAFAPGAVAVLKEAELVALWVHPDVRG